MAEPPASASPSSRRPAPQFTVPNVAIVSMEHPCLVKDSDRAIHMLGGASEIAESLLKGNEKPLGLRFQPDDPTCRQVTSYNKKTNNLLLKVTVPKRTGRKRKRASDTEFMNDPIETVEGKEVKYLLQYLRDNQQTCETEIVGQIGSTHVWRTMPDFVYSSKGSDFMNEVVTKILPKTYPSLKQWSLPRTTASATTDTEAIRPLAFSTLALPQNHVFRHNPVHRHNSTKTASDDTEATAVVQRDGNEINVMTHLDEQLLDHPRDRSPP